MKVEVIKYLWDILDDIDTASDVAKSNNDLYREIVEKLQKKRWSTGIKSDGYSLDFSGLKGFESWEKNTSALDFLVKSLKKDQSEGSYYHSWKSSIAMSFVDEYEVSSGTSNTKITEIANKAADRFLQQLIN